MQRIIAKLTKMANVLDRAAYKDSKKSLNIYDFPIIFYEFLKFEFISGV
jgi:hypothetical protein